MQWRALPAGACLPDGSGAIEGATDGDGAEASKRGTVTVVVARLVALGSDGGGLSAAEFARLFAKMKTLV